jgi:hypothetical protein
MLYEGIIHSSVPNLGERVILFLLFQCAYELAYRLIYISKISSSGMCSLTKYQYHRITTCVLPFSDAASVTRGPQPPWWSVRRSALSPHSHLSASPRDLIKKMIYICYWSSLQISKSDMGSFLFPWERRLTPWQQFRHSPSGYLATLLYKWHQTKLPPLPPPTTDPPLTVVCISDTHTTQPTVPDGDILLHAGDLTKTGSFAELQAQLTWLNGLPHAHVVVIAGNHDSLLDPAFVARCPERVAEQPGAARADLDWGRIKYLHNSGATLDFPGAAGRKVSVWGAPLTPEFGSWAFQAPRVRDVWTDTVPAHVDVVLTHGPPLAHRDLDGQGDGFMLRELWRARPRLVVCGHVHRGRGREELAWDGVQAAYDGVFLREKGVFAMLGMVVRVGWRWVTGARANGTTTLVNAAVTMGGGREPHPATVVEL